MNVRVLDIYIQLDKIANNLCEAINEFNRFYCNKTSIKKIDSALLAINNAVIKYLAQQPSVDPNDASFDEATKKLILEAKELPLYSATNVLVWIKRYKRLETEFSSRYYRYRQAVNNAAAALEKLQRELTFKQRKNSTIRERIADLEAEIMAEMHGGLEWESSKQDLHQTINSLCFKISKNDMLSLFNLRHERWEQRYINELPDVITPEEFEKAAFAYRLEADDDCVFFKIYFKHFSEFLKANKGATAMAFDVFQEIFGPVPTYNLTTDRFGNVVSIQKNRPNLKVIRGLK